MATKSGTWRIWLSDLLIAAGFLILLVGALFWTRTALAAGQVDESRYLPSPLRPSLPLPALYLADDSVRLGLSQVSVSPEGAAPETSGAAPVALAPTAAAPAAAAPTSPATPTASPTAAPPTAAPASPAAGEQAYPYPEPVTAAGSENPVASEPAAAAGPTEPAPTDAPAPVVPTSIPPTALPPTETPLPTATPAPTPEPTEGIPEYSPVVRIAIPSLDIERAVVPVGLKVSAGGMDWDTDRIFASQNRSDLVGQLVGSYSPGQGGTIQLIGHNYNDVSWGWAGVFVNIKNMQTGDQIFLYTEDGRESIYQVIQVKQVPWRSKNDNELEKHHKFMGPSETERLTLITCGGANIWPFPARVYVVAEPVK